MNYDHVWRNANSDETEYTTRKQRVLPRPLVLGHNTRKMENQYKKMDLKKLIKEVDNFIKYECLCEIGSITCPRINKIDFNAVKKQFDVDNLEKGSAEYYEYQSVLRQEKAWKAWQKLKEKINNNLQ